MEKQIFSLLANNENGEAMPIAFPTQEETLRIEAFLTQHYMFRHNILSDKDEFAVIGTAADSDGASAWRVLDDRALNSIILRCRREGVCKNDPAPVVRLHVESDEAPLHHPAQEWFAALPEWDGHNRVAELFGRIPGITTEQICYCGIWMRSMVSHWLERDAQHGNETVPVLIGPQGCGKSTFCVRLMPECLREYAMDHFNLANKFDADVALTSSLLITIDEFDRFHANQQAHLKQALSRVKVNSRRAFGRNNDDKARFASFIATTNSLQPLTDPTGSRRFVCLRIPEGCIIDNVSPIDYEQLYAQVLHELNEGNRYWFTNEECREIERTNQPYRVTPDLDDMLASCFRRPEGSEEGEALLVKDIAHTLHENFPDFRLTQGNYIRLGACLKKLSFASIPHGHRGKAYRVARVA